MSPFGRIAGFTAVLAVVFVAASVAGAELNPSVDGDPGGHEEEVEMANGHESTTSAHDAGVPPGLTVAQRGYRLVPERSRISAGASEDYRFSIVTAGGETVREYDVEHERRMHLIVVRRDFEGFQHLHPRQAGDGSWRASVDLDAAGVYRVFADFAVDGESLTLGSDLFVAGGFEPEPLPPVVATADAGDGYEVRIDAAAPRSGGSTAVRFAVRRNGRRVDAVEPYLGADGHLVALRQHDLAFLHVHPQGDPGGSGPIAFEVEYPTSGRYRLFLQFKHGGEVRTAAFTQAVDVSGSTGGEVGDGGH